MNTLKDCREKLAKEISVPCLFARQPNVPFRSAQTLCPDCRAPLKVLKTRRRTLRTLHLGCFSAHETFLHCTGCSNKRIYAAEQLKRLAPRGCSLGYDVMVFVGMAFFMRHNRTREIIEQLLSRNVPISSSEVEYLARKFIVHLALAHRRCTPRIKKAMSEKGGYMLHLDGTCEGGGPMLMSSLDSISEIVLGNVKVPSEKADELIPMLRDIKRRYGTPLALVHDMGAGILAAVKKVFEGVPDFICHFHFLRDLGKDLLEKDYDGIRARLRTHGIAQKLRDRARLLKSVMDQEPDLVERFSHSLAAQSPDTETIDRFPLLCAYSLIQWALEGKTMGHGYGFPFDQPHLQFARRLVVLSEHLEQIKDTHLRGQWKDNIPFFKLSCELNKVSADKQLLKMIERIDHKIQVFDQLRAAMRIAHQGGSAGLNSGSEPAPIGPIKKALKKFRRKITSRCDYSSNPGWKTMIKQIDKYWDKLFADPIAVQTSHGLRLIQPQRTNNILERFFRDFRRGVRRKTGRNSIGRFLQSMIADTPLVRNLENPQYLKILLNGHTDLEACFADIDVEEVRTEMDAAQSSPEKVPKKIRRLIATPSFPDTLCRLFRKAA